MDIGFQLPDVVWSLGEEERKLRAKYDSDVCVLDGKRYFLRGVLYLPVRGTRDKFGWGLWAEVSKAVYDRYVETGSSDAGVEQDARGVLANALVDYDCPVDCGVTIKGGSATERPVFVADRAEHRLYREQHEGITPGRLHDLLAPYSRE
jgi:hypothetical protein